MNQESLDKSQLLFFAAQTSLYRSYLIELYDLIFNIFIPQITCGLSLSIVFAIYFQFIINQQLLYLLGNYLIVLI